MENTNNTTCDILSTIIDDQKQVFSSLVSWKMGFADLRRSPALSSFSQMELQL